MGQNIKAIVWDMGGVILRTEDQSSRKLLAEKYGMTIDELYTLVFNSETAKLAGLGKIPENDHWLAISKKLSLATDQLKEFRKMFWMGDQVDHELLGFIRNLKKDYKTGLLSNAWSGARKVLTEVYNCIDTFQFALFSSELGLAKPDPEIYRKMLEIARVNAEQTIFVDDMPENIEAANLLGIHSVQFKNSLQARQNVSVLLYG